MGTRPVPPKIGREKPNPPKKIRTGTTPSPGKARSTRAEHGRSIAPAPGKIQVPPKGQTSRLGDKPGHESIGVAPLDPNNPDIRFYYLDDQRKIVPKKQTGHESIGIRIVNSTPTTPATPAANDDYIMLIIGIIVVLVFYAGIVSSASENQE